MVRESQHGRHLLQLRHAGNVPAVYRSSLQHQSVPNPSGNFPNHFQFFRSKLNFDRYSDAGRFHFRLLRHRDVHQNGGHGHFRQRNVPGRNVEQTRLLHRRCRVSKNTFSHRLVPDVVNR